MSRYLGPARFRVISGDVSSIPYDEGRCVLGDLMRMLDLGRIKVGSLQRRMDDGTVLIAHYDGSVPQVTVIAAASAPAANILSPWVPRGFVCYPASHASATGWGLPAVLAPPGSSIYAPGNLDPGLDAAARWTPGGELGEVFISRQFDAGYPSRSKDVLPILYNDNEPPNSVELGGDGLVQGSATDWIPPPLGTLWAGYRLSFDDFSSNATTALRGIFAAANAGRAYQLPIRGYYNPAQRAAGYATAPDFAAGAPILDHALVAAPAGYQTASERKSKDGHWDAQSREAIGGTVLDMVAALNLDGTDFHPARTSLCPGLGSGATALTAVERNQWIGYGQRRWYPPANSPLPILSWDGYPSWNLPFYLVYGTIDLATGHFADLEGFFDVFPRNKSIPIFSKKLFASGRQIGELPAVTIAAGIQTRAESNITIDRILVITWQLDDQQLGTNSTDEVWGRFRTWYIDVPRRNGFPLGLDHCVIGAYDAVTNPKGWRGGDLFHAWERDEPLQANNFYLLQPFAFSDDGTRAVFLKWYTNSGTPDGLPQATELLFSATSSPPALTLQVVDAARCGNYLLDPSRQAIWGIDYLPTSHNFAVLYTCLVNGFNGVGDVVQHQVLRWNGSPLAGIDQVPTDLWIDLVRDGFITAMVFILDPFDGAAFAVDQCPCGSTDGAARWRVREQRAGALPREDIYADTFCASLVGGTIYDLANTTDVLMPSYVRDVDGHWIFGYDIVISNIYEGSLYESDIGLLDALTGTMAGQMRLYPLGVV